MDTQSNIQLLEIYYMYNTKTFSHFTEKNKCNTKKKEKKKVPEMGNKGILLYVIIIVLL